MKKLILKTELYHDIPLNEYYLEKTTHKGLVFIQHGYQSNKEYGADFLAIELARKGFFVVSIDAYKHGERIEEPFLSKDVKMMLLDAPIVIRHTAIDYIKLHKKKYMDRFAKYDFIGISMGAMIAFYLSTKTDKIKKLAPVIGTPDFLHQAYYNITTSGLNIDDFLTTETIQYLTRISPMNHVSKMKFEQMFILNGDKDEVVPKHKTVEFYHDNKADNIQLNIYDEGHNVNRKMQLDIFEFIDL